MPTLQPILVSADQRRDVIREKARAALTQAFPWESSKFVLHVEDVKLHPAEYSSQDQKQAILEGRSLTEPLRGVLVLKDKQGQVIERSKPTTLLQLPWFTPRHTFIVDGNEYSVSNQVRLRPGVYARRRGNQELEAQFNLVKKGGNFGLTMEPESGHMHIKMGTSSIPLYPILRSLGVPHADIAKHWGGDLAEVNEKAFTKKTDSSVTKLYEKIIPEHRRTETTHEARVEAIRSYLDTAKMDPEVVKKTLGVPHETVKPETLLRASEKLLHIYKKAEDVDDRDSLEFKRLHSVDDFIKERILLSSRELRRKVVGKLDHAGPKPSVAAVVAPSMFTPFVKSFLTTSDVSSIPTQYNPMEIIDVSQRITPLGEGGIGDTRAVPVEARQVHASHLGIIDPVRSVESSNAGIDVRATIHAARDEDGLLYTPLRNAKTGKHEYVSAKQIMNSTIAFPGQDLKTRKAIDAMVKGELKSVSPKDVDYVVSHTASMYSPATSLIPFIESMQGNRALMAAKMQTQALQLKEKEQPWVQVASYRPGRTMEQEFGEMTVPVSPVTGSIEKIDSHYIYIRPNKNFEKTPVHIPPIAKVAGAAKRQKTIQGVVCKIELEPGDTREGVNKATGKKWARKMYACYGYVPKTEGDDGEAVDIYLKEDGAFEKVYIVHQLKKDGTKDEDKCMLGFASEDEAKKMYLKHVPEWCYGSIDELDWDDFRAAYLADRVKTAAEAKGQLIKIPYDTDFPLATKSYLDNQLTVKAGDKVTEGQPLAESNFTDKGALALGKNLKVGLMAYKGLNSNDAIVISASAARKLTSVHTYKERTELDADRIIGKERHRSYYGNKYSAKQYAALDEDGVVKKGAHVEQGDPLFVSLRKNILTADAAILGKLNKSLVKPYRDEAYTWEHEFPGTILEVAKTPRTWAVVVKSEEPAVVGDKIVARHANKGVISSIIPDEQMIQDESGKPLDVLLTSAGIVSRINPSQVIEMAVAKVAEKTGKPIVVPIFSGRNNVQWAKDLLKEHGVKDKETVFDPLSGKKIPGIMVGPEYILKLMKTTATNYSAHGIGSYDINEQPSKGGGGTSAGSIGRMEFAGLVAHNARNILREQATIKSQKNDEFWKAVQLGLPTPAPKSTFAYQKFGNMITGAGIKLDKTGNKISLGPLTDKEIERISSGAVTSPLFVRAKDLRPEKDGLFDPALTGGTAGEKWSHINLHEPIVNPVFHDPARRFLGMSGPEFNRALATNGAVWVRDQLAKIDLEAKRKELLAKTKTARGTSLDSAIKQLKYIDGLKKAGLRPEEAYILTKFPVVPPVARPILPSARGDLLINDANYLYRDLMLANEKLKTAKNELTPEHVEKARMHLQDAVTAVVGMGEPVSPQNSARGVKGFLAMIAGTSSPKHGYLQSKLIKRQLDLSGRGTIVPDVNLGMDEIGLPEEMIWTMFEPFIIGRLVRRGYDATRAKEMVTDKSPAAREELLREVKERPVIYNRAPSLHRFNLIAAYPRPVSGATIRIPASWAEPLISGDFDGDAVQIHTPATKPAIEDAKRMTLSNLLFSDRTKDRLHVIPAMEAVVGMFQATSVASSGKHPKKFKNRDEALSAYRRGEISLSDPVEVE